MAYTNNLRAYSTIEMFAIKKVAADPGNTTFRLGGEGAVIEGKPDILWTDIVYFDNSPLHWARGMFHGKGDLSAELYEPEDFALLRAADCKEGVLYIELGDVIDSEKAWHFGDKFPIRFS